MAKFMLIYRGEEPETPPSPEQMQMFLEMWGAWFGKFGPAILDGGDGLKYDGKVLRPDGMVTDGPYVETKEIVAGYSVIAADDLDAALAIARECPIVLTGGKIEIREFAGYN